MVFKMGYIVQLGSALKPLAGTLRGRRGRNWSGAYFTGEKTRPKDAMRLI